LSASAALLGGGAHGFDLGLSGGRVSRYFDGRAQAGGDTSDPVGLCAQLAEQFRAGHPWLWLQGVGVDGAGGSGLDGG
jgi:hypothetical protein